MSRLVAYCLSNYHSLYRFSIFKYDYHILQYKVNITTSYVYMCSFMQCIYPIINIMFYKHNFHIFFKYIQIVYISQIFRKQVPLPNSCRYSLYLMTMELLISEKLIVNLFTSFTLLHLRKTRQIDKHYKTTTLWICAFSTNV